MASRKGKREKDKDKAGSAGVQVDDDREHRLRALLPIAQRTRQKSVSAATTWFNEALSSYLALEIMAQNLSTRDFFNLARSTKALWKSVTKTEGSVVAKEHAPLRLFLDKTICIDFTQKYKNPRLPIHCEGCGTKIGHELNLCAQLELDPTASMRFDCRVGKTDEVKPKGSCSSCLAYQYPERKNNTYMFSITKNGWAVGTARSCGLVDRIPVRDCACGRKIGSYAFRLGCPSCGKEARDEENSSDNYEYLLNHWTPTEKPLDIRRCSIYRHPNTSIDGRPGTFQAVAWTDDENEIKAREFAAPRWYREWYWRKWKKIWMIMTVDSGDSSISS
ncbi:hypothetical protein K490DRAFT_59889 [Saccharata proteae CBS 121410]|uniref:Uncharacterized protein n=1 Tax=Saccharata proteae CBS 121410 TaxID=1314787 RepID=A0A9P4HPI7_9PEZI|nr:hypothetical protein K490DRAFT_59889 [Saccharata proteae CBS 121410]